MKRQDIDWQAVFIGLFVIGLLIVINAFGGLRWLERGVRVVFSPAAAVLYKATDILNPMYSSADETLVQQNDALKNELSVLAQANSELSAQLTGYQQLQNELDFAASQSLNTITSQIISRSEGGTGAQLVTINVGSDDGLIEGLPVMYTDGGLLGITYNVFPTYTEVALMTSGLTSVQARVLSETSPKGLITGEFGVSLRMDYILKDSEIEAGQTVVTNGLDEYIPAGLVLGTIQSIEDESSELFKSAVVLAAVRYSPQAIVSVVLPN